MTNLSFFEFKTRLNPPLVLVAPCVPVSRNVPPNGAQANLGVLETVAAFGANRVKPTLAYTIPH